MKKSVLTAIGKRKLELSNLEKVLFPDDHLTKGHLIAYYYRMAPTILTHLKGRPLSLVRFPDGIDGERWYQKRLPEFAPRWIDSIELGSDDKIRYVLCDEEACLCWLANLAAIEMHHTTVRRPNFSKPDMMVFDLDPPEGTQFQAVVEVAGLLRPRLEKLGYHPFVKTSGRKGIHVSVPIQPEDEVNEVVNAAQAIAKSFVEAHPRMLTLQMKKEARGGKLFVDIYRNHRSQTVVAAYSVRAAPGAPVSMPLEWSEMEALTNPTLWNTRSAPERIEQSGDAWEAFGAYAVRIHSKRSKVVPVAGGGKLKEYERKRRFESTPEPGVEAAALSSGSAFVVHRHHASHLHYDLRLESEGVLRSWAVPKGLPPRPGIKRLAIATEDHPLPYLTFEGKIPAGQYGAGQMWVFASGRYEISKQKKDGFYFRLHSKELSAEYRIYKTSATGKEYLLERVDSPQRDWLLRPPQPMLAEIAKKLFQSDEFIYEVKWDGFRVLTAVDDGEVRMWSRGGREIMEKFPELQDADFFRASGGLFDGEIVVLDENGVPQIDLIQQRFHASAKSKIERLSKNHPAVVYVFDCLALDGRSIVDEPLVKRREWVADAIRPATSFRLSEAFDDGEGLFQIVTKHGLEGLIAKRRESRYQVGRRSGDWLKIKVRETILGVIVGFTRGEGDRTRTFGALQIAGFTKGKLRYLGKVGTGFSEATLREIGQLLDKLRTEERAITQKVEDEARTIWVKPEIVCQLSYSRQNEKAMREPVFIKLRPDLTLEDCRDEEQER